jgi:DNA-binding NtrC family response regulator
MATSTTAATENHDQAAATDLDEPDRRPELHVLVIDDERNVRRALSLILDSEGYQVHEAESAERAEQVFGEANYPIDLVVLDLMLPGKSGLEWLESVKQDEVRRHIPVIVISGHASGEEAAAAIKLGAVDFFEKPLQRARVLHSVSRAVQNAGLVRRLATMQAGRESRAEMIGTAPAMERLHREIERVAPTKAGVLITGPSGTGKELVSRAIHRLSPRASDPFVKVNCAAIPRELIESELFGHEKGAFTGAESRKRGVFEQAHGATLFLDEIGDMDLAAQAKVLRVLQSGEVSRVGSEQVLFVDVRILAATNKDLTKAVREGQFREDLYFRLNVFPIACPGLDDRKDDIPALVNAFMHAFCEENGMRPKPIAPAVYAALIARTWPGHVRELKNVVERAVILSGDEVTIADLPEDPHVDPFADGGSMVPPPFGGDDGEGLSLREVRSRAERRYIIQTLVRHDWNVSRAAVDLGVERTNLHKKIRAYQIQRGQSE